jgi:hypothetical protein
LGRSPGAYAGCPALSSPPGCRDLKPYWDAEAHERRNAGRHPLAFENLYTVDRHEAHQQTVDYLARTGRPAMVIAPSGMDAGGRVANVLKCMLGDERHDVLFIGYQAAGTPGRAIQHHGPRGGWVELDGERIDIRAKVHTIGGYSAHADRDDLLGFIQGIPEPPGKIRLIHGEPDARQALKAQIETWAPNQWPQRPCHPRHVGSEPRHSHADLRVTIRAPGRAGGGDQAAPCGLGAGILPARRG